jgi:diguanylate cyclase (GGDEF)-like protein
MSLYLDPEESESVLCVLGAKLGEPASVPTVAEFKMRHVDGSWRHLEATGVSLLDDPQVEGIALCLRDVTERKALEKDLARRALCDPLTGLPNRALFVDRLEHALARATRRKEPVAVIFLDLDNFKAVNDCFGHDAGDRLLVATAWRLRSCLRQEDTVARLGGDEFTILLDAAKDAARAAERIAGAFKMPFALGEVTVLVTASVGVALSISGQDRGEDLLRRADTAMYRAKKSGKGRWEAFSPAELVEVSGRVGLRHDPSRILGREKVNNGGTNARSV